jgi:hypothetical protein
VFLMSTDLKNMLNVVAEEDRQREVKEFEDGFSRYRDLLIKVSKVRPFEMMLQAEGPEFYDMKQVMHDLRVLERAHLLKETLKDTFRAEYHQFDLTADGEILVEKFAKEAQ